jgi:hypothetical protein
MKLRLSIWSLVVVAVALSSVVLLSSDQALASNMGFKMNKVIEATATPAPKGENLVALPYRNPYGTAEDVCSALGLTAATGKIRQLNALAGTTASHNCGALGPFTLALRVGIIVTNPTAAGGILVGSHAGNPPGSITLQPLATPAPKGQNHFPVLYHTTAVNAQDLCTDLGLPAGGKILRRNAATGVPSSHNCGDLGAFNLVLGESTVVTFPGASALSVAPGHPAHF